MKYMWTKGFIFSYSQKIIKSSLYSWWTGNDYTIKRQSRQWVVILQRRHPLHKWKIAQTLFKDHPHDNKQELNQARNYNEGRTHVEYDTQKLDTENLLSKNPQLPLPTSSQAVVVIASLVKQESSTSLLCHPLQPSGNCSPWLIRLIERIRFICNPNIPLDSMTSYVHPSYARFSVKEQVSISEYE